MPILVHNPDSAHIHTMTYDPATKELGVKFSTTGKTYTHRGIPPELWEFAKHAPSAGTFYHRWIKQRYKLVGVTVTD